MKKIAGPRFIGDYDYSLEEPIDVSVLCPEVSLLEFSKVSVMGGTNIVFTKSEALYPDMIDPKRDMFSLEISGEASTSEDTKNLWVVNHGPTLIVDSAISLLGECNGNYAHWLLETLPKLVLVDELEDYRGMPILVDGWIHPTFFDTLALLNKHARQIIRVEKWQYVNVERLVYITPPSYTAPENREYHTAGVRPSPSPAAYPMSDTALSRMRELAVFKSKKFSSGRPNSVPANIFRADYSDGVLLAVHKPPVFSEPYIYHELGERIYLKRTAVSSGNPRQLVGVERVESILADYGFLSIDPATLTFSQQVLLLQNAKCVVAPLGAALANTIFAPPGLKVIGLSPFYAGADYHYFSNMMGVLGHELRYVLGPQIDQPGVHWLHRSYMVDLEALKDALDLFCGRPR
jgi:hypothetical protein